jgi:hypothetical protein
MQLRLDKVRSLPHRDHFMVSLTAVCANSLTQSLAHQFGLQPRNSKLILGCSIFAATTAFLTVSTSAGGPHAATTKNFVSSPSTADWSTEPMSGRPNCKWWPLMLVGHPPSTPAHQFMSTGESNAVVGQDSCRLVAPSSPGSCQHLNTYVIYIIILYYIFYNISGYIIYVIIVTIIYMQGHGNI